MLQWKFDFSWTWCLYVSRNIFIIWFLVQILQNWKTENVDNFDITTHVHWFLTAWTKYWNWGNVFVKFKELIFWSWNVHICYIACMTYVLYKGKEQQTSSPVENLTPGQIFFKDGLIWLVWGSSFSKELFRHIKL